MAARDSNAKVVVGELHNKTIPAPQDYDGIVDMSDVPVFLGREPPLDGDAVFIDNLVDAYVQGSDWLPVIGMRHSFGGHENLLLVYEVLLSRQRPRSWSSAYSSRMPHCICIQGIERVQSSCDAY